MVKKYLFMGTICFLVAVSSFVFFSGKSFFPNRTPVALGIEPACAEVDAVCWNNVIKELQTEIKSTEKGIRLAEREIRKIKSKIKTKTRSIKAGQSSLSKLNVKLAKAKSEPSKVNYQKAITKKQASYTKLDKELKGLAEALQKLENQLAVDRNALANLKARLVVAKNALKAIKDANVEVRQNDQNNQNAGNTCPGECIASETGCLEEGKTILRNDSCHTWGLPVCCLTSGAPVQEVQKTPPPTPQENTFCSGGCEATAADCGTSQWVVSTTPNTCYLDAQRPVCCISPMYPTFCNGECQLPSRGCKANQTPQMQTICENYNKEILCCENN